MSTQFRRPTLAAGIAPVIASASGAVVADTVSTMSQRSVRKPRSGPLRSQYLRAGDLKVSLDNGKATLTGTVEENVNKDLANEIALGVEGVAAADNILLKPEYTPRAPPTAVTAKSSTTPLPHRHQVETGVESA